MKYARKTPTVPSQKSKIISFISSRRKKKGLYFLLGEICLLYCFWITIKLFIKYIAITVYFLENKDKQISKELCNHVFDQHQFMQYFYISSFLQ